MINCKKATELISKGLDDNLTLAEKIQLNIHLFICEFCEQFKKQVVLIQRMVGLIKDETDAATGGKCLSADEKRKMLEQIKKQSDQ